MAIQESSYVEMLFEMDNLVLVLSYRLIDMIKKKQNPFANVELRKVPLKATVADIEKFMEELNVAKTFPDSCILEAAIILFDPDEWKHSSMDNILNLQSALVELKKF